MNTHRPTQFIADIRSTEPCGNGWTGKDKHFISRPIGIRYNSKADMMYTTETVYGCTGNCEICYARHSIKGISDNGFRVPVSQILDPKHIDHLVKKLKLKTHTIIRCGVLGDPSLNIPLLILLAGYLYTEYKIRLLIMTQWHVTPTNKQLEQLATYQTIIHCSTSSEYVGSVKYDRQIDIYQRFTKYAEKHRNTKYEEQQWIWRILSYKFNIETIRGKYLQTIQNQMFQHKNVLEQPAKIFTTHQIWKFIDHSAYSSKDQNRRLCAGPLYKDHYACHSDLCSQCNHLCMTFPKTYYYVQTKIAEFEEEFPDMSPDCRKLINQIKGYETND